MLPYRDSKVTTFALILFFIAAVGYGLFEARGQIEGPTITVVNAAEVVHDPLVAISGTASRISSLSMNGDPISVTENGAFDQPYLLAAGYNRIVLDAQDSYGRKTERVIEITYQPMMAATSSLAASSIASSTASTTTLAH